jgi:hypothetical protein
MAVFSFEPAIGVISVALSDLVLVILAAGAAVGIDFFETAMEVSSVMNSISATPCLKAFAAPNFSAVLDFT